MKSSHCASDIDLVAPRPNPTINGTIKTEPGKGTYRKTTPKSAAGVRKVVLPYFAVQALRRRRESARAYISKPAIAADVAHVLQELADPSKSEDDANTRGISAE